MNRCRVIEDVSKPKLSPMEAAKEALAAKVQFTTILAALSI